MLVSQGVPQNLKPYDTVKLVEPQQVPKVDANGKPVMGPDGKQVIDTVTEQTIAQGPVASQEIIKEFGTNGGGFFNANSAHPYENPTPLTNLIEMLAIFAIGSGLTYTLGRMVRSQRHGWAVWAAMAVLFLAGVTAAYRAEAAWESAAAPASVCKRAKRRQHGRQGSPLRHREFHAVGHCDHRHQLRRRQQHARLLHSAGRHGSAGQHDASEVVFGGVGSGMYGMIIFIILSVFIAGLMVGRTPEYLGKKIEAYEVKMAMLVALIFPLIILAFTASRSAAVRHRSIANPGPHGFSEILYAYTEAPPTTARLSPD